MTTPITSLRSDAEIAADIHSLVRDSFSVVFSREHFSYAVQNGVVIVKGHLASPIGYDLFVDNLTRLEGVAAVDDRELYDDERLRLAIGAVLPRGLRVRVQHGVVALMGRLDSHSPEVQEAVARIGEMPGIIGLDLSGVWR